MTQTEIGTPRHVPDCGDGAVVFQHIQKTGGTSLHRILRTNFKDEEACPERFNHLDRFVPEALASFRYFSGHYDRASVELIPQKTRIVTLFREPKNRILSLYYFWRSHKEAFIKRRNLRGPELAKRLSLVLFLRHGDRSVQKNVHNGMTRVLLGKSFIGPQGEYICPKSEVFSRAIEYIEQMHAFGITEDFDRSVQHIVSMLKLPMPDEVPHALDSKNITDPRRETIEREVVSPEADAELDRLTEMDRQIYAYALGRFRALTGGSEPRQAGFRFFPNQEAAPTVSGRAAE